MSSILTNEPEVEGDPNHYVSVALPNHGTYTITADMLDRAMDRYLPASPAELRRRVEEAIGLSYADVTSVAALLVVLADIDGPVVGQF